MTKVYNLRDESSNESDMEYITSIVAQSEMIHAVMQEHVYPKAIYTAMLVDETEVKFQVDSGASVNVIPINFVANKKLEPTTKMLQMWNDTTLFRKDVLCHRTYRSSLSPHGFS